MCVSVKSLSGVRLFVTPWTVARQAPLSMEFSRQEYCSGLPFASPGDLPNSGIEPGSRALQADALSSEPRKAANYVILCKLVSIVFKAAIGGLLPSASVAIGERLFTQLSAARVLHTVHLILKNFQYFLQHFLSQIILVVFLNLASVKKLHFSKNYKHLNYILNIFDIYFLYLKIANLRSIKMTRGVTTFVRVSAKLPIRF